MPWIRGLIFTLLVPVMIGIGIPELLSPDRQWAGGNWQIGWLPVAVGSAFYLSCLMRFLAAGGTPAIFFTEPLRFLIGKEPSRLVSHGLYRFSRNPMYVGVISVVFGQALLFKSSALAWYGAALCVMFHLVVVLQEEPHLRKTQGEEYEKYCRTVPRWIGYRGRR